MPTISRTAASRSSTSSGRMSRMPRGGAVGRRSATRLSAAVPRGLLAERHDDLRLARALQERVEAHDRGDDRRRVLAGNHTQRRDRPLEARVHRLEAVARWTADDDRDVPLDLVLGHDDLVDAVAVEIDGHGHGLEVDELAADHAVARVAFQQLQLEVAAATDRAR